MKDKLRRRFRGTLAVVLSLTMIFTTTGLVFADSPDTPGSAEAPAEMGLSDGPLDWKISSKGTLTIGASGYNTNISEANDEWSDKGSKVKKIVIKSGIVELDKSPFSSCTRATSISIPASVTSIRDGRVFNNMKKLKTISVAKGNQDYSSSGGVLFEKGSSDRTILRYPEGKLNKTKSYSIPKGTTYIGRYAFYQSRLKTLTIPASVTDSGDNAFENCQFTSIKCPGKGNSFKFEDKVLIGRQGDNLAWYSKYRKGMHYVIPESVDGIKGGAFSQNPYIMAVTLHARVLFTGRASFNCENLRDVIFLGNQPATRISDEEPVICGKAKAIVAKSASWDFTKVRWAGTPYYKSANPAKYLPEWIEFDNDSDIYYARAGETAFATLRWNEGANLDIAKVTSGNRNMTAFFDESDSTIGFLGKYAGSYELEVEAPSGCKTMALVVVSPQFQKKGTGEAPIQMYAGDTMTNKLIGVKSQSYAKWSVANKAVVSVDKYGRITAKAPGISAVRATFNDNSYEYYVSVSREAPGNQDVTFAKYDRSKNIFYIKVNNRGLHTMKIKSANSLIGDMGLEEMVMHKLKLASGDKYVSVVAGKSRTIGFKVENGKLPADFDLSNGFLQYDFSLNGANYWGYLSYYQNMYGLPGEETMTPLGEQPHDMPQ